MCSCSIDAETMVPFFLWCHLFIKFRYFFFSYSASYFVISQSLRVLKFCVSSRSAAEYYRKTLLLPFLVQHEYLNVLTSPKVRTYKRWRTNSWRVGRQFLWWKSQICIILHYFSSAKWKFSVLVWNQIYWDFLTCRIELVWGNNKQIYWKERPYHA